MPRVLVPGGAGYIGSVLVPRLLQLGHHVTVIDNFMYQQPSLAFLSRNRSLEIVYGDIRDASLMATLLPRFDVIIPLASIVGAPACNRNPSTAKSINVDATLWILENISHDQLVLMPTTNSAYGSGGNQNLCDETSPLNPLSSYAKEKVLVEKVLMQRSNSVSFRLATVFGISPRMRLDLLVNNFTYRALKDGFLTLFEANFKRNYIHLSDVAQAFVLAISNPDAFKGEIFNVGLSSANISKLELCDLIRKQIPNFVFNVAENRKDPDQRNYVVSNAKVESKGFVPEVSLEDGISELICGLPMFDYPRFANA